MRPLNPETTMKNSKTNPTRNSVPAKNRGALVALLNQALADLGDLYSQTKQAHWNVRGQEFYQLHLLFDSVADTAEEHWDDVAERAVQIGGYARGTVRMAAGASQLPEWPEDASSEGDFVTAVTERFALVANSIREGIEKANGLGDLDTADLFTEISRKLDKSLWMLEASK
jgi:starvation-inducible DNA-binding protein